MQLKKMINVSVAALSLLGAVAYAGSAGVWCDHPQSAQYPGGYLSSSCSPDGTCQTDASGDLIDSDWKHCYINSAIAECMAHQTPLPPISSYCNAHYLTQNMKRFANAPSRIEAQCNSVAGNLPAGMTISDCVTDFSRYAKTA